MLTTFFILVVLLLFSAIFAGSETALFLVGRDKGLLSEEEVEKGQTSSVLLLLKNPSRLLMTVLLGNLFVNMSFFAFSTFLILKVERDYSASAGLLVSLMSLFLLVIFGEILPKTLASVIPLRFSRFFSWWIYRLSLILSPFILILEKLIEGVNRMLGINKPGEPDKIDAKHLVDLVDVGENEGWLHGMQGDLMETLIKLKDVRLGDVMIPRVDVQSCSIESSVESVLEKVKEWGREWMPLYLEHHDDIAYYVDCVNLLGEKNIAQTVEPFAIKLKVFPELARMDLVLRSFLEEETPLALVVDEFGEMVGMVTWDDVMKNLLRKFNVIHEKISKGVGVQVVEGRTKLSSLDFLDIDMKGDSLTLSGYLIEKFDGIPKVGEVYHAGSVNFMVLRSGKKNIEEVMLMKDL